MRATLTVFFAAAAFSVSYVNGFERFTAKLPNGPSVKGVRALGHVDRQNGGGARNAFGRAFAAAGFRWSTALCEADTDGDGQTNGQELGDPCCSWIETGNLAYIRDVSDPSDPASRVNPIIFKGIQCTKSEDAVDAADKKAKSTPKPKPTTPAPTTMGSETDWEDASSSGNGTTLRKNGQQTTVGGTSAASLRHHQVDASIATAVALGVAVAWVIL